MKYLILGSEGQIGNPLSQFLRENGHQVIGLDIKNGTHQDLRYNYYMNETHFKWADFVFFLAFDVGGSTYLKKYEKTKEFLDNNINIMTTVFDLLEKYQKPFIFASSQMSNMNHSPYGVLKRVGEFYTKSLSGINVRFWNVYGVETDPEKTHVITDFLKSAYYDNIIKMKTTGEEYRQFLHVNDCCRALYTLSQTRNLKYENYDVTSFVWDSILNVAKCIQNIFPKTQIHPGIDKDLIQGDKRNEPDLAILDLWHPEIGLQEGILRVAKDMSLL